MDTQYMYDKLLKRPQHPSMASSAGVPLTYPKRSPTPPQSQSTMPQLRDRTHSSSTTLSSLESAGPDSPKDPSPPPVSVTEEPTKTLRFVTGPPSREHWKPDDEAPACGLCKQKFGLILRRHHCRRCGDVFCGACSSQYVRLDQTADFHPGGLTSRVCRPCFRNSYARVVSVKSPVKDEHTTVTEDRLREPPVLERKPSNNIPITPRDTLKEGPIMSVAGTLPSDWSWSTF
ncbi:hypothetical protein HK097_006600 [Rhizophlyctis rosea]|uniref:FYVE-type domain-containing protein n=1 Tax=Rhizophlyctis rosea TaxID=64517 RepID=A0AAD5SEC4_9FUNG|nr:hypothetical protein HK097_006600 [Rhizophlyctis rosea]